MAEGAPVAARLRDVAERSLPLLEALDRRLVRSELDVVWGASVGQLREAVDVLVVDEVERALLRALADVPDRTNVVVTDDRVPVGALTLRRRPTFWEPSSYQCLPGPPLAIAPGREAEVVRALGVELRIEALERAPGRFEPDEHYELENHVADLTGDWEGYWPRNGGMNYRTARKRCKGFTVRVDHPGDVEWSVRVWHELYGDDPRGEVVAAADRLAVWPGLLGSRIHSVALLDGDRVVATTVNTVDGGDVGFACTARDTDYDRHRAGTRVLDATFHWAAEAGYERFHLGAGSYKRWWAPADGTLHGIAVVPNVKAWLRRAGSMVRSDQ